MSLRRAYHVLIGIFALLVIGLQSNAVAHSAQYGDVPHDHDNIVCVLDGISCEDEVHIPPVSYVMTAIEPQARLYRVDSLSAPFVTPPGRAPPPRSPPAPLF